MPMPKLDFIINKAYDTRMIYEMLRFSTLAGKKQQAITMGLEYSLAKRIAKNNWQSVKHPIEERVTNRYQAIGNKLNKTRDLYQSSWNEINNEFFTFIAERTGYAWSYKKYLCVVSAFHKGISNWNGNVIARIWSENPYTMRKITAHELIITHIFFIFHHNKNIFGKIDDRKIWAIAEISAWCLTGLERKLIRLWPWITKEQRFPLKHNYPQLYSLQKKLKKIYIRKGNFRSFLEECAHYVKRVAERDLRQQS